MFQASDSAGQPMPITPRDHLKQLSHRCLLILLSDTQLDEKDCTETLLYYGDVKKVQMTPNCRAAFVDFECEHSPLLVARCFEIYKLNPEVPMPKGVNVLLPGCSIENYLFLQHVPRLLSTSALQRHFLNDGYDAIIHRPGSADKLSSRVVIQLKESSAFSYHHDRMRLSYVTDSIRTYTFYAIPEFQQLTNYKGVCGNGGCDKCNVLSYRPTIEMEDRKAEERQRAQMNVPAPIDGGDYNTSTALSSPKFADVSEKLDWGIADDKHVSSPHLSQPGYGHWSSSVDIPDRSGPKGYWKPVPPPGSSQSPEVLARQESFENLFKDPRIVFQEKEPSHTPTVPRPSVPSFPPFNVEDQWDDVPPVPAFAIPCNKRDKEITDYGIPTTRSDPIQLTKPVQDRPNSGFRAPPSLSLPSSSPAPLPSFMTTSADGYAPKLQYQQRKQEIVYSKDGQFATIRQFMMPGPHKPQSTASDARRTAANEAQETGKEVGEEAAPIALTARAQHWANCANCTGGGDPHSIIVKETEKEEDVVVEESVDLMIEERPEMDQKGEIEEESPPALNDDIPVDGSDVVVSESIVGDIEEVVVEKEEEGGDGAGDEDEKSDHVDSVFSLLGPTEELYSGDLLPDEEDDRNSGEQFLDTSLSLEFRALSLESLLDAVKREKEPYKVAAGGRSQLMMMMEGNYDEVKDAVRDTVDRKEEAMHSPTPQSTVSLEYEEAVSPRAVLNSNSDEDTIHYDTGSESNTVSDASSVVGEGGNGRFLVDPDEWDEMDQMMYGYNQRLSTIEEDSQEEDATHSVISNDDVFMAEDEEMEENEQMENMDGMVDNAEEVEDEEEEEEGLRAIPQPSSPRIDARMCEEEGEKVEPADASHIFPSRLLRRSNEIDSDDEEEKEEEGDSDDEERLEKEDKGEGVEHEVPEGENRDECSTPIASLMNESNEGIEVVNADMVEMELRTPIRRWSRTSVVDEGQEDEDRRSVMSEYHDWLTREDGVVADRGGSLDVASSDTETEIVPLPSSLATITWGRGIVMDEMTTVDTTVQQDETGPLLVSSQLTPDSLPNVRRNAFGTVMPTFGNTL